MTSERLRMLGEMVGGLGLRVTVLEELESLGRYAEKTLLPVRATREDFRVFAEAEGYTRHMAHRSFNTAMFTGSPGYRYHHPDDHLPTILFDFDEMTLELRSVHRRLVASNMDPKSWFKCGKGMVRFLAHIVNDRVRPGELLPIDTSRGRSKT